MTTEKVLIHEFDATGPVVVSIRTSFGWLDYHLASGDHIQITDRKPHLHIEHWNTQ